MSLNKKCDHEYGMTLVEILVVSIVLSVVVLAAGTVYISAIKEFHRVTDEAKVQTQAMLALDHITKNLMGARSVTSSTGTWPVSEITADNSGKTIKYKVVESGVVNVVKYYPDVTVNPTGAENITDSTVSVTYLGFDNPTDFKTKKGLPTEATIKNYITINIVVQRGRMERRFSTGVVLRGMNT